MKYLLVIIYLILFISLSIFFTYNFYMLEKNELQSLSITNYSLKEDFKDFKTTFETALDHIEQAASFAFIHDTSPDNKLFSSIDYVVLSPGSLMAYPFHPALFTEKLPAFTDRPDLLPSPVKKIITADFPLKEKIWLIDSYLTDKILDSEIRQELLLLKFKLYYLAHDYNRAGQILPRITIPTWHNGRYQYAIYLLQKIKTYTVIHKKQALLKTERHFINLIVLHNDAFTRSDLVILHEAYRNHTAGTQNLQKASHHLSNLIKTSTYYGNKITYQSLPFNNKHYITMTSGDSQRRALITPVTGAHFPDVYYCLYSNGDRVKTYIEHLIMNYDFLKIVTPDTPAGRNNYTHPLLPGRKIIIDEAYLIKRAGLITKERNNLFMVFAVIFIISLSTLFFLYLTIKREKDLLRIKANFINAVSHELKTPLTGIKLCAQTLIMRQFDDTQKVLKYSQNILEQSGYLETMIGNILDFSKIQKNKYTITLAPIATTDFLNSVVESFKLSISNKQAILITHIPDDLPAISGDENALRRVFTNLLDNAFKYSPTEKKVEIQAAVIHETHLSVCVKDHGIGIPKKYHKKIFKDFYRVRDERAASAKGTGLGLAMVKHIIESHKGSISLESTPGLGSNFTVIFPLAPR